MIRKQCRALIIGCNYTGTANELQGCHKDALNIQAYLQRVYGSNLQSMVLIDSPDSLKKPTVAGIYTGLMWLLQWENNDCDVWLTYSGHGGQMKDDNNDEPDGQDEVIYPVDFAEHGAVPDDYLRRVFNKFSVRARIFCVSDACHSGTGLDLPFQMKNGRGFFLRASVSKDTKADVYYFSGCTDEQTSSDTVEGGAMTGALLGTLAAASEEFISARQLMMGIGDWLRKKGFTQTPQLSVGKESQSVTEPLLPTTPAKPWHKRAVAKIKQVFKQRTSCN